MTRAEPEQHRAEVRRLAATLSRMGRIRRGITASGQPVSAKNSKRGFVHEMQRDGKTVHYASVARSAAIIAWYKAHVPELQRQFELLGMPTITRFVHIDTHQYLTHDVLAKPSPDGDAVMSAAWDALVHAKVLQDDKLVVTWGGSRQRDSARPRVEIEVRVL